MAKATAVKTADQLLAADVHELEYVDDDKSYYVTLQLGQACRWRKFTGGQWLVDTDNRSSDPNKKSYRHVPAIYERAGPFVGLTVNGLISKHNQWRKLNSSHNKGGEIQHQLLVLATEETTDLHADASHGEPAMGRLIRSIVKETVTAVMDEMTKK
uniref:Uncharacterized protein n=1 Tax=viral metagenome TaxID=1070528 RepID=A0A6M3LA60_9ZZZZ